LNYGVIASQNSTKKSVSQKEKISENQPNELKKKSTKVGKYGKQRMEREIQARHRK